MKIYICEDNKEQRDFLTQIIKDNILMYDYDMHVAHSTASPYEILDEVKKEPQQALYFLDIDLGTDMTGLQLAHEIRKYDVEGMIIFITTHTELTHLTFLYKVEALDYIIKDNMEHIQKSVFSCLETVRNRLNIREKIECKRFIQKIGERVISVRIRDILFFESISGTHKVIMHLENRQTEFYGKLKDIEKTDELFYRCHHSYIVNIQNISEIDKIKREVILKNGEICYVSIRYLKGLIHRVNLYNK